MKAVTYETYDFHDVTGRKTGTVVDLLFDIPYLIGPRTHLPPRDELNGLLRKGIKDVGMSGGCRWGPFELSPDEYAEVVAAVEHDARRDTGN